MTDVRELNFDRGPHPEAIPHPCPECGSGPEEGPRPGLWVCPACGHLYPKERRQRRGRI
jgi:ribosomal protein L37AE/L43A